MSVRTYSFVVIAIIFCAFTASCKKAERRIAYDDSVIDTMSVNMPGDTLSDGDFSLTDYDSPPTPIQNPMPVYPVKYKRSGIQGVVVLDVEVLNDGTVGEVKVMKSLLADEGALDDIAVSSVKSWIFKPALKNKKAVVSHVNIPIPFTLKS